MTNSAVKDIIELEDAGSLYGLFLERIRRSPDAVAYRYFDQTSQKWRDITWQAMFVELGRWQCALKRENLQEGDRVALMMGSGIEWVLFEQAALGLGLVVVPLYANDRAENVAYIIRDSDIKVLLIEGVEQWSSIEGAKEMLASVQRLLILNTISGVNKANHQSVAEWLPENGEAISESPGGIDSLATIVYTSGTTGRPKGVMLSHRNILWNARSALRTVDVYKSDEFLSFLPLSHALERSIGYYLPMMAGAKVAYARSISHLADDLMFIRPTVLISVPRIFERVCLKLKTQLAEQGFLSRFMFNTAVNIGWRRFLYQQQRGPWRFSFLVWPIFEKLVARKLMAKLGGRIRVAVCGGAPLSEDVAKIFIGLGLPLIQGYGLTETSPVISVNRIENNKPASVGEVLPGVEVKVDDTGQLLTRSPSVMMGYWNNPQATAELIDAEGWLNTGDKARLDDEGSVYITGRTKDILVLANGEKVPPADMEAAIAMDPLFEQVLVLGEGRAYLSALVVLNADQKETFYRMHSIGNDKKGKALCEKVLVSRISRLLSSFPGYAQVRAVCVVDEPWTVDNGLLTPTLKVKRKCVLDRYCDEVEAIYHGH